MVSDCKGSKVKLNCGPHLLALAGIPIHAHVPVAVACGDERGPRVHADRGDVHSVDTLAEYT